MEHSESKIAQKIDKIAEKYFSQKCYTERTIELNIDENPPIVEIMKHQNNKNILVLGVFGHGKSYLINSMIGKEISESANSMNAVTNEILMIKINKKIDDKEFSITLIDTPGFEPGANYDAIKMEIRSFLIYEKSIDLIWYVRTCSETRISESDQDELKIYRKCFGLSSILILNKANKRSVKSNIEDWKTNIAKNHMGKAFSEICYLESLDKNEKPNFEDLKELIDFSVERLNIPKDPESEELSLATFKKIEKDARIERSKGMMTKSLCLILVLCSSAAAVGISPIPFSDYFLLIPIEASMIGGIARFFGYKIGTKMCAYLSLGALSSVGIGKGIGSLLCNISKMIPVLNSLGMYVNGTIAFCLTAAIGLSWSFIIKHYYLNDETLSEDLTEEKIEELKEEFKKQFERFYKLSFSKLKEKLLEEKTQYEESGSEEDNLDFINEIPKKDKEIELTRKTKVDDIIFKKQNIDDYCCICLTNYVNVECKPCGHKVMCESDYNEYVKNRKYRNVNVICPICQQEIEKVEKIEMPNKK